jgi:hypothetical protein
MAPAVVLGPACGEKNCSEHQLTIYCEIQIRAGRKCPNWGHDCRAGIAYRLVRWPTRLLESWHDRSCDLSRRDADTRHRHLGGDLWHPAGRAAAILMRDERLRLPLPSLAV